jgi:hypothetical protein
VRELAAEQEKRAQAEGRRAEEQAEEMTITAEFAGIERCLDELSERLARLQPLRNRTRSDFGADPYLRDIAERNLEIAAQCGLGAIQGCADQRSGSPLLLRTRGSPC